MRMLTRAAGIAALAIALTAPFALAQTAPNSDSTPADAPSRGNTSGPGMMHDQAQPQPQLQRQTEPAGQAQPLRQPSGYGPGMMSGPGGYGAGMMSNYGMGWMGQYGGIWVPILLAFLVGGLVVWIIKQKAK